MDMQKTSFDQRMGFLQQFCIDTGTSLSDALKLPLWFMVNYYGSEAWNIQKAHLDKHDQMSINNLQHLENLQILMKNLLGAMKGLR